jgi:hypothetical protein
MTSLYSALIQKLDVFEFALVEKLSGFLKTASKEFATENAM